MKPHGRGLRTSNRTPSFLRAALAAGGVAKSTRLSTDGLQSCARAEQAGTTTPQKPWHFRQALSSPCRRSRKMAGSELRAALEERLGALAIRTEVVEHPEVRLRPQEGRGSSAAAETRNRGAGGGA